MNRAKTRRNAIISSRDSRDFGGSNLQLKEETTLAEASTSDSASKAESV